MLIFSWAVLIFTGSSIPEVDVPPAVIPLSSLLHLIEYAILAALLIPYVLVLPHPIFFVVVLSTLYGIFDEFHQIFVPGRNFSYQDMLVDFMGSFAGAYLSKRLIGCVGFCIGVAKSGAESARRKLIESGGIDTSRSVERVGDCVFFPVLSGKKYSFGELVLRRIHTKSVRPHSLRQALKGILTVDELEHVPSSFTIIGDIAVIELDSVLLPKKNMVAEALLETFHNIGVVALKTDQVSGEYRVPDVEVIGGEQRTHTVHKENGCSLALDIATAYFNPRTSTERMRVTSQMLEGERVLVLFAGVGPYAILAAKKLAVSVTAVELNPEAVKYMRENVLKNKVDVEVIEGDVRDVIPGIGSFDRIIMPLPKLAASFLDVVVPALKKGGMIHYYCFAHDGKEAEDGLASQMLKLGEAPTIVRTVECGAYSPCMNKYCIDFRVG